MDELEQRVGWSVRALQAVAARPRRSAALPRTTKPEPGHKIYPYLLRDMAVTRPNQVWAMDITYIPMARGFVSLAVVLDRYSRRVDMGRLAGKIALISGASRGQGAAEATLFAAEGAAVVLTDVLDQEGDALASALRNKGANAAYCARVGMAEHHVAPNRRTAP
jgi:hypothetical protein